MDDPGNTGKAIGDHWFLIAAIAFIVAAVIGLIKLLNTVKAMLEERMDERVALMMTNGASKRLQEMIKVSVVDAMDNHKFDCSVRNAVVDIHERLLVMEKHILKGGHHGSGEID